MRTSGERDRPTERRGVHRMIAVLVVAIAAAEWRLPAQMAVGGLYILPVLLSLWSGRRRTTLVVATVCSVLALLGLLFAPGDLAVGLVNRSVALFAVWVTANLGLLRASIERELDESRQTTETALRSIADAVITTDARGTVTYVNYAAEELTGWTRDEALGCALGTVFRAGGAGSGEEPEEGASSVAEDELPARAETTLATRAGLLVPIESSVAPLRSPTPAGGAPRSRGRVLVFRDISERRRHQEAIERLAFRDALTGLPNRNSFHDRLDLELRHAERHAEPLALFFLDLDGFKGVNDGHGHATGDLLLRSVASRLLECVRAEDTVARLGGDEFTVILARVGTTENAERVAAKIVAELDRPHEIEGCSFHAPPSIGIALFPDDARELGELMRKADQAMYRAKGRGGRGFATSSERAERTSALEEAQRVGR
jgi:diguanylate cyclase (GGDEF)-like protein/PAS domain S-box-containing protein